METKSLIHMIGTRCQPEVEEKFNIWYDQTHIPMLLKFNGLKGVTRYKLLKDGEEYPEYLVIYEFDSRQAFEAYETSPELAAALDEMRETWRDGGWEMIWRVQYEAMKTWHK